MVLLSILIVFVHIERQLAFVMSLPDASIVTVTEILFVTYLRHPFSLAFPFRTIASAKRCFLCFTNVSKGNNSILVIFR